MLCSRFILIIEGDSCRDPLATLRFVFTRTCVTPPLVFDLHFGFTVWMETLVIQPFNEDVCCSSVPTVPTLVFFVSTVCFVFGMENDPVRHEDLRTPLFVLIVFKSLYSLQNNSLRVIAQEARDAVANPFTSTLRDWQPDHAEGLFDSSVMSSMMFNPVSSLEHHFVVLLTIFLPDNVLMSISFLLGSFSRYLFNCLPRMDSFRCPGTLRRL